MDIISLLSLLTISNLAILVICSAQWIFRYHLHWYNFTGLDVDDDVVSRDKNCFYIITRLLMRVS